jgi:hypothetical protein
LKAPIQFGFGEEEEKPIVAANPPVPSGFQTSPRPAQVRSAQGMMRGGKNMMPVMGQPWQYANVSYLAQ